MQQLDLLIAHRAELADFLAIRDYRRELDEAGLADFLARSDRIGLAPDRLPALFETLVAHAQADMARRASPEFGRPERGCAGSAPPEIRRPGSRQDQQRPRLVAARLLQTSLRRLGYRAARRLDRHGPSPQRISQAKTVCACQKPPVSRRRRHQSLKPCFMMSPLSLAKVREAGTAGVRYPACRRSVADETRGGARRAHPRKAGRRGGRRQTAPANRLFQSLHRGRERRRRL